jgi:PAS domain S-box-containing protein
VADDSATDRMIIKNILSDYCVLTARDGEETIRMLEEHDGINLLILDLNMPKMDGFQVLEYIKENERYKNLRTIILTIYDEADNEIAGLKLGAVDYIRKPINMAAFKARIDVHVEFLRTEAALKQQLEESERSKYVLLTHLPGLAYRCNYDRDWTMQYVSEGCYDLTGYPPESLLYNRDLSFNELISPEYRELLWNEWKRILKERKPFKYEYEIITAAGEKKWVLEMGQGIYNDKGEVEALEGIVLDISDRKAVEDALKYNNEHDKWTGLYNREYLLQLLERDAKLKKKSKKALIGINLSMVQLLTSTYGHQYSRNLIKKAAEALGRYCSSNRILFYPHENQFIFYLYDYEDKKELVDFSSAVAETLKSLFVAERIGGGIGIVEIEPDQDELDIDLLLRKLMIASERYVSMLGRDFELCFYDEELEAVVSRERDIIEALSAIAADDYTDNELFLLYQPILDLRTGSICGFEALARLRTKKLGIVSPLEFIPIAEKTKLILPIGEKVFAKALGFLKSLDELGYDGIFVSINISAIQLFSPDFTSSLFELISKAKVNPKNVSIEITESVIASDYDSINEIIKKLRSIGIRIAIDDFGTGHSSLAREKGLKADCMKIDRYFVDKLLYTDHNKAITSDIISIAHKLGQCTIAEGVEQEGQLQYLKKYNCDMVQGYLISEPLDEDKAIVFLKDKDKSWQ